MTDSIQDQIANLQNSINGLEARRSLLGEAVVNPALAALKHQLAALEEQVIAQPIPGEERRMVTILFMDMVGSTAMAEKLDPEEWRQVLAGFHTALGEAVTSHHGIIAQYLGDGLLAFFGAKEAGEHDPENAIRSALDGQAAVAKLNSAEKVQVRAGIHSGLVVVGELGETSHKEFTASGDAMNLAARLQSAAPAGGILISHDTYSYVRGVFDLTPRPPLIVKGKSEPLQTFLVRRAKPRPFHSVARGVAGVETSTVGRETEIQTLQAAYLRTFQHKGMVWAQLLSDPGVGKSRLVEDMKEWLDLREETTWLLRARAFPDDANQPFALVRRMWFDRFQIAEDAPLEQAEMKWVERFREYSGLEDYEEPAHALGLLVGLSFHNSPHIKGMRNDPAQVKGRALVVSRELVTAIRRRYPLVVLLEDLQWSDAASWEYLVEVFLGAEKEAQPNGLFVIGAARPDWLPPEELTRLFADSSEDEKVSEKWGVQIHLMPLTDQATRILAKEILQRVENMPEQIIDLIVERSEGVPYYTEELVNWFIDHNILDTRGEQWHLFPEKLKEQPLPATLQHLLLTRLSSLSHQERAALQRGAIFGRRFWSGGLKALGVPAGDETLGHLQPRGFVELQPVSSILGDTEWNFHQTLLQEVTYESVLKRERASLHKVAAGWLEQQARQAGRLDEFAGLLGEHCERAGELIPASDWYLQAGRSAFTQGATRAAQAFYTRALDLLPPVERERRWQVLLSREKALSVLTEAEPWKADTDALLELARSFNDDNFLAEAYMRQALFGIRAGEVELGEHASREALAAARRCSNEAIEAKALAWIAVECVNKGDKAASSQKTEEALKLARSLGDENVLSFVLGRAAFCYGGIPDIAKAVELFTEQIELDHRLGNRSEEATGLGNMAEGYIWIGMYKQGRAMLEQARSINEALGARRALAYNLAGFGYYYQVNGDLLKARQFFEQAIKEIMPTQDARGKVYGYFGMGTVLLEMGDLTGAVRRFSEAYELAISQKMDILGCESSAGLAACAVQQGRLDEAQKYIQDTWSNFLKHGWVGMSNPTWFFGTCVEVFDALGDEEKAREAIESGHRVLVEMADTIHVPEWRQSFLENNPHSRVLIERWERKQH
jgi:class 3 adenylate cyclase/predicted ATPase